MSAPAIATSSDRLIETLVRTQSEHREWAEKNFPGQGPLYSLAGLVEELGEWMEAETVEETLDAIGDICIFSCGICNAYNIDMAVAYDLHFQFRKPHTKDTDITIVIGRISHCVLKLEQGIRTNEDHKTCILIYIGLLLQWCEEQANMNDELLHDVIDDTWESVKERDWTKNKVNGDTNEKSF